MLDITRTDMARWMEADGCAQIVEHPKLNWSRVDAYVADQGTGHIAGNLRGFHLFETVLRGHQRANFNAKLEPGHKGLVDLKAGMVSCSCPDADAQIEMDGTVSFLQILIDDDIFRETWADMFPGDPDNWETWTFIGQVDEQMRRTAIALFEEARMPSLGGELYAEALAQQLAILILRRQNSHHRVRNGSASLSDAEVAQVIEHMHAELHSPGGLDTFSSLLNMDSYAFARGFKARIGISPHQYLMSLRIEVAKDMLANTSNGLADIAYATGFSSQSHMNSVFRKLAGVTPGEYRKRTNA